MTRDKYRTLIPDRPYCTDDLSGGITIQRAEKALTKAHIQHNRSTMLTWMVYDVDTNDVGETVEESGLPEPTYIAHSPRNGHGHVAYLLQVPVLKFDTSRSAPLAFYRAVERGFTRRLNADHGYSNFLTKCPFSGRWPIEWIAHRPYRLDELNDSLDPEDKAWLKAEAELLGVGRNCAVFHTIRKFAYGKVANFKKSGESRQDFEIYLREAADQLNQTFPTTLTFPEIRCICRSVARFCWEKMDGPSVRKTRFLARQSAKGKKAWSKTPTLTKSKPWEAEGISRRTWERRRKAQ